jgi:hypothetical protein
MAADSCGVMGMLWGLSAGAKQDAMGPARLNGHAMPWATGDNVQVRGLCRAKQDEMGPVRLNGHALGHRRQCSSAWTVDNERWGWECMLQLQETEDRKPPAATTLATEFLLRVGESREFLGLWINSGAIHDAKRSRATQVITCSFPCGKWLHMFGARASP